MSSPCLLYTSLKAYALYFSKFIEAYKKQGIPIFAVMPQNEFNSAPVSYTHLSFVPLPTATISPFKGFSFAESGIIIPPNVFSSAAAGLISTRSANGLSLIHI